jgi:hypothetical protein
VDRPEIIESPASVVALILCEALETGEDQREDREALRWLRQTAGEARRNRAAEAAPKREVNV